MPAAQPPEPVVEQAAPYPRVHAVRTDEQATGLGRAVIEIDLHPVWSLTACHDPGTLPDATVRETAQQESQEVAAAQAMRTHLRTPERLLVHSEQQAVARVSVLAPAHAGQPTRRRSSSRPS